VLSEEARAWEAGEWLGVEEFAAEEMRRAPAPRLSMGGRFGLCESRPSSCVVKKLQACRRSPGDTSRV